MTLVEWLAENLRGNTVSVRDSETDIICLCEKQADKTVQTVQLVGAPKGVAVLKMRQRGGIDHLPVFKTSELKLVCDYLLIAQFDGRVHAIFVELKKTLTQEQRPREQLRRSLPLLDYLLSVKEVDCGGADVRPDLKTSYVLIGEKISERIDKQRTRLKPGLEKERHESIEIRAGVGTAFPFRMLVEN